MFYEFGIFSMFYMGKEMPEWINCRSKGRSISFTIPSSCNNLQGLNFCYCMEKNSGFGFSLLIDLDIPFIKISNITKNHTWIYKHNIDHIDYDSKDGLCLLSHWMFGPNEMEAGDHITITLEERGSCISQWMYGSGEMTGDAHITISKNELTFECGIGLVYDEDGKNEEEEKEDVLGYYKSWNHIIGGDLSSFQLTTGEYVLHRGLFIGFHRLNLGYVRLIKPGTKFKEEGPMSFKAFSQKKKRS
ncbi:hypothetical protein R6Q59_024033 [Mikania micrantha]